MRILIVPNGKASYSIQLDRYWKLGLPILLAATLMAGLVGFGYAVGSAAHRTPLVVAPVVEGWKDALLSQKKDIEDARQSTRIGLDVLTQRLGELQAHVSRLDALGGRLVKMAKLDATEFDFSAPPALGGTGDDDALPHDNSLLETLDALAAQLDEREAQLGALDHLILNRNLEDAIYPAGWPVARGYISSSYGNRRDPFTGRQEQHMGVDFASKSGADVLSVADGVVAFAGRNSGYGNTVEIEHGNGYSTRYGHNRKVLVSVGQRVKKGDKIALMGSTGRSTGPHVHFEVLQDGAQVDPDKFIQTASE